MTTVLPAAQPVSAQPPDGGALNRARLSLSRFRSGPWLLFWLLIVAILVLPIALFLLVAFSPRLLGQGAAWFTLQGFRDAFTGTLLRGTLNSLVVGVASAVVATAVGAGVAWCVLRTDVVGRRLWAGSMFALLLAPSYLIALGWERLLEPAGVLELLGIPATGLRQAFYGPLGVVIVLSVKGVPFAFLALSGALRGLGEEFEAAARVHGGGRSAAARVVLALLAPACWSAFAIVFAESVSDFGVAATLANDAHFPVATFTLYNAIDNFPVQFPVAAAVGWILMALAGLALLAQTRALRGRSYRVLGGRSRPARRLRLSRTAHLLTVGCLLGLVVVGLGIPSFGAVSASLIDGLGSLVGSHRLTLTNYSRVLHSPALRAPLQFSAELAVVTATV
ncbi:MAG: binding-protein-dependent transport system inner rane component, partial [Frankiales bacterium]|nr:binding-protein-dependent transport system inner rane component [Frankiales bacterium]